MRNYFVCLFPPHRLRPVFPSPSPHLIAGNGGLRSPRRHREQDMSWLQEIGRKRNRRFGRRLRVSLA